MQLSKLQSVAFDGVYALDDSDEILEYVNLVTGIIPDDYDDCVVLDTTFYYPDIITPLFDIFTACYIVEYDQITESQQSVIDQLQDLADQNNFKFGAAGIPSVDAMLECDDYQNTKHVYDLLGGIYTLEDDEDYAI
jgi:hypothetical protein